MKKGIFIYILLVLGILSWNSLQANPLDSLLEEKVTKATEQLEQLLRQNAWNNANGLSHTNQYIYGDLEWLGYENVEYLNGVSQAEKINNLLKAYNRNDQKQYLYNTVKLYVYVGGNLPNNPHPVRNETRSLAAYEKSVKDFKANREDIYANVIEKLIKKRVESKGFWGNNDALVIGLGSFLTLGEDKDKLKLWSISKILANKSLQDKDPLITTFIQQLITPYKREIARELEYANPAETIGDALFNMTEKAVRELGNYDPSVNPTQNWTSELDEVYGPFRNPLDGKLLSELDKDEADQKWNAAINKAVEQIQKQKKPGIINISGRAMPKGTYNKWTKKITWIHKTSATNNEKGLAIYVLYQGINFVPAKLHEDYSLDKLARAIWNKSSVLKENSNAVFYYVPFFKKEFNGIMKGCAYPFVKVGKDIETFNVDISTNIVESLKETTVKRVGEQLQAIYTQLPKPYKDYRYYFRVDGSVFYYIQDYKKVAGQPVMRHISVFYDKEGLQQYNNMRATSTNLPSTLRSYVAKRMLKTDGQLSDFVRGSSLKEINVREESVVEYHRAAVLSFLISEFNNLSGRATSGMTISEINAHKGCYWGEFHNLPQAAKRDKGDDPFLKVVDAVGFILTPIGGDVITDIIGGIYCSVKGKKLDAAIYFVSATIPFSSFIQGFVRKFCKGAKVWANGAYTELRKVSDLLYAQLDQKALLILENFQLTLVNKNIPLNATQEGQKLIWSIGNQKALITDADGIKIADEVPFGNAKQGGDGKPELLTENLAQTGKRETFVTLDENGKVIRCFRDGTCFVAGTPIFMASKTFTNIEKIITGQKVYAENPKNCEVTAKPVEATFVRSTRQLIRLGFVKEIIYATPGEYQLLDVSDVYSVDLYLYQSGVQLQLPITYL